MKKTIIISIVILAIVGLAWYFLIYLPSQSEPDAPGAPAEGSPCSTSTSGRQPIDGTIINGVCVKNIPSTSLEFKKGDNVYINQGYENSGVPNPSLDIPLFSYPAAVAGGTYLLGVTRKDWNAGKSIGKFIEVAGTTGYYKISVNGLQIWKFSNGFTTQIEKLTQDIFIEAAAVKKTIY